MIGILKMVMSMEFIVGAITGIMVAIILKPLISSGLKKLFAKND